MKNECITANQSSFIKKNPQRSQNENLSTMRKKKTEEKPII